MCPPPSPPDFYIEARTPNVTVFGKREFKFSEIIRVVPRHQRTGVHIRRGRDNRDISLSPCAHTEEGSCEDTVTRQLSASQEERPHPEPACLPLGISQTSRASEGSLLAWWPDAWSLHSAGLVSPHPCGALGTERRQYRAASSLICLAVVGFYWHSHGAHKQLRSLVHAP